MSLLVTVIPEAFEERLISSSVTVMVEIFVPFTPPSSKPNSTVSPSLAP